MSRIIISITFLALLCTACNQKQPETVADESSLLWKVSGNGLEKPSYLYGTMHILCKEDASLSNTFKGIIKNTDVVYFEIDMDNLGEMMSALSQMKMRNDTTLRTLLSEEDYEKLKEFYEENEPILPFSEIDSYQPILAYSLLTDSFWDCENKSGTEEEISEIASKHKKETLGIETLEHQMALTDSIPYREQAKLLKDFVDSLETPGGLSAMKKELHRMVSTYKKQDIDSINVQLMESDPTFMEAFDDILLYNRNRQWVDKLKVLMKKQSLVLAVGCGHLPGEKGLINLLRKEGYTLTPIKNEIKY